MCKHLALKAAPNSNYNVKFHAFKGAPTAILMFKYLAFKGAPNSNFNEFYENATDEQKVVFLCL